jgi:hypothetical protein
VLAISTKDFVLVYLLLSVKWLVDPEKELAALLKTALTSKRGILLKNS